MNYSKILIWCVVSQWGFTLLSVGIGLYEEKNMRGVYAEVLSALDSISFTFNQNIWLAVAGLAVLLFFVSSIGICFLKSWAKILYTYSYLACISPMICIGVPFYTPPLESLFSNLSTLIIGIIMALLYFTPLSDDFLVRS